MLNNYILENISKNNWQKPLYFDLRNNEDINKLLELFKNKAVSNVVNPIDAIKEDLTMFLNNTDKEKFHEHFNNINLFNGLEYGTWVYFPWNKNLIRYPMGEDYRNLKTYRYRNLIKKEQQHLLNKKRICVFGMSVGSNVALSIVRNGIGEAIAIGDFDMPSVTNMGRIELLMEDLPYSKLDGVAKKISQIDPFIEQKHFPLGFQDEIIPELLAFKPDVIIDEIDDMEASYRIRSLCKKHKILYLSVTEIHDNLALEVIRFDADTNAPLYVISPSEKDIDILKSKKASKLMQFGIEAILVGIDNWTPEIMNSILNEKGELGGVPQLGSATIACAGLITTAVRRIFLGENISTKLYSIQMGEVFDDYISHESKQNMHKVFESVMDKLREV